MLPIVKDLKTYPLFAAVNCPKNGFESTLISACEDCDYFAGFAQMTNDPDIKQWDRKYCIRCVHPIERRAVLPHGAE